MLKAVLLFIENLFWRIKCTYNYYIHGPYGVTKTICRMPNKFLVKYMRKYGATIGENCLIDSGLVIHRPKRNLPLENLIIGNNVYLGHNLLLDLTSKIVFEDNTALGANCQVWTHVGDYKYLLRDKNDYAERIDSVIFKNGFVGYSGSIYNPGSHLGKFSRVLALSMVSNGIPDKEIWGGIPAKKIRLRTDL